MTELELAALRGEIFGLKIIVVSLLSNLVRQAADPIAALDEIQLRSARGIEEVAPADIPPNCLEQFRRAAATCVLQTTEVAKASHEPPPPAPPR